MGDQIVKVTLQADSRGMLGRRCPSSDCAQYFKLKPGTGLPTSECYCPYCETGGDTQSFSTPDQIEYAKSIAAKQVMEPLLRQFGQNLTRISNQTRGGFIELKFSMRTPQFRIHHYREADVETDVTCDNCGLEFAVYGVFALCPDCRQLNAFAVFTKSLEACRRRLALLDLEETGADADLERSILRDVLTSSVAAFDAVGKRLREAAPTIFPAKPRNLFQNFRALDSALAANGRGIAARLGDEERASRLQFLVQVRHIIEHNMGVVDDDFIRIVPACGHLRGKIYPLARVEVEELLVLLSDLTDTLRLDFSPPASGGGSTVTSNPAFWNEMHQSELTALDLLSALGYERVDARDERTRAQLLEERSGSERGVVLLPRLERALRRLNPWLSDDGMRRAIRAITHVDAATLIEANEKAWVALTFGVSVDAEDDGRKASRTVRYFDFDTPHTNEFLAVQQLSVSGTRKGVKPDVTVFVNGIPLAVIECKAPTLGEEWLHDATDQFERYQELGEKWRGQGAPQLFHTVQLTIAACGQGAYYGTAAMPGRWYAQWKSTYPLPTDRLEALIREKCKRDVQPQDTLLAGMVAPANLLDLVRNFVAFETENGRRLRKVARYQQFRAVNRALERIRTASDPAKRGGVIWHTQGSGKSLTMLWLASKLRRMQELANPAILVVTDRRDLDRQIEGAFLRAGYQNPTRARSVRQLRELLAEAGGQTVMTTVQKFQEALEAGGRGEHPALTLASNMFVMVDEAHRTQYKGLAMNMRAALPNACFLGFTGTPIDKNDRSTKRTFGEYIDTYTIQQSVDDRATVPIYYESRLPDLHVQGGETVDALFERMFADRTPEEREAIKRRYATEVGIAGAPRRIELICLDLLKHYDERIRPNGFKAQIVAATRDIAVSYKETLDKLTINGTLGPASALVMSSSNDDEARLAAWRTTTEEQRRFIDSFKEDPPETLAFLIVCDMLLTGFDAPVEQVMYLDSPLREHTLLQAIARVNRVAEGKTYGLVVDYWGVSSQLQDALAIFDPDELGQPMLPLDDVARDVELYRRAAIRFFARVNRDDLEACVRILEPEDTRAQFDEQFRKFGRAMDQLMPDPRAAPYRDDLRWLGRIRLSAAARFRDDRVDISDCGEKVRALIAQYIGADRIDQLLEPVSILSPKFDEEVDKLENADAKASEMEHAIKEELKIRYEENPVFYQTLRERLEQILAERRLERMSAAQELKQLRTLTQELRSVANIAESMGLTPVSFALYELLLQDHPGEEALKVAEQRAPYHAGIDEPKRELALVLEAQLVALAVVDWRVKDDVQREMRRRMKRQLRSAGFDGERVESLTAAALDIARRGLPS